MGDHEFRKLEGRYALQRGTFYGCPLVEVDEQTAQELGLTGLNMLAINWKGFENG